MNDGLDPAGVAVFVAAVSGIAALSLGRPEQWGFRRLAVGVTVSSAGIALVLLAPSTWWFGAIFWGLYLIYLGWSYVNRRRRTTHERLGYIEASAAVLGYVALTDGRIDPREKTMIRDTYDRAGFSSQDLEEVNRVVEQCERNFFKGGSNTDNLFVLLRNACAVLMHHSNEQTRFGVLRAAIIIAASDGFVSSDEERALRASANWLGVSGADYENLWRSLLGGGWTESDSTSSDGSHEADNPVPSVPPDLATYYASLLGVP